MNLLIKLLIRSLAIMIAAYFVPGVVISDFFVALIVAIVLGFLNTVLRPILIILTLPINILTLGLFTLIINTLMILLTSSLVRGFQIYSFWTALVFSIILWLVNSFLNGLAKD